MMALGKDESGLSLEKDSPGAVSTGEREWNCSHCRGPELNHGRKLGPGCGQQGGGMNPKQWRRLNTNCAWICCAHSGSPDEEAPAAGGACQEHEWGRVPIMGTMTVWDRSVA